MSNSLSHLKRIRNVVSASCLMIGGGLTGALAQSGIADTSSRALEELERKQAEAYTLVERLEDVSERVLEVLDGEKLLYHADASVDADNLDLHYYAPWTSLEKYLEINKGDGKDYAIGGVATNKLYVDEKNEKNEKITNNNPRHRVCLAEGLHAKAKIPHVGSKFSVLTYFDRDTYGFGVTPTELLAYAVSHSAKPGVVKGLPIGIGVITKKSGTNIEFTDVKGNSTNVSTCLAETVWGTELGNDDKRLAIYHPVVKPEQLRFVLHKMREVKRGSEFGLVLPTGIYRTCLSRDVVLDDGKIVELSPTALDGGGSATGTQYSRDVFKQTAEDSSDIALKDSAGNPIDNDDAKDAWANLLASGTSGMWDFDELSCRAQYTYRTTVEDSCDATVGGVKKEVKVRVGVRMIEKMPVAGVAGTPNARYYYTTKANGTKEQPTYIQDTSFARQEQASLCDSYNALTVKLEDGEVKEVEKEAGEDEGVSAPVPGGSNGGTTGSGSPAVRAQCTPRSGNDEDFAKLESLDKNTALSDFASLGLDKDDPSLYYPHDLPGAWGTSPTEVFNYYLKYAPAYAPLMAMHEAQGMYDKTNKRFVSANLKNKPYFWDAVVRRPHQYRTDIDNPVNIPRVAGSVTGLWGHGITKGLSGAWYKTDPVTYKRIQPLAWDDFRTRIGDKYDDWDDFDAYFPRPDGVSPQEFLFVKGLVKQAFGMWADNNMRISGTKHPHVDDIIDPTVGVLRDAAEVGLCASDYHDMAVMYRIYGQNYVVNAVAKDYGNTKVTDGDYSGTVNKFPLLEPPWYPVDHPFYQRHMQILTKAGYKRHETNETMIAQIKANFEAKESEMENTWNDPDYTVITYDAQCGDWLVAEEYLGANDHTASDFATKFPRIKAMREKAEAVTLNTNISYASRQNTSEADVEGGGKYHRGHASGFIAGDPREIPYHGLKGGILDDDGNVEIGHIAYTTTRLISGYPSGRYRVGKLSHLFGAKRYVSGTPEKWARVTPCVQKPGHVQQTNVYQ